MSHCKSQCGKQYGHTISWQNAVPVPCHGSEACFSILGHPGAVFWSTLRWCHRDCETAAEPGLCHVHQRQQSRQVPHPTLPELVSFLHGARLPLVGFSLGASSCREVGWDENPSCLISLVKVRAFSASSSMFSVVHSQLPSGVFKMEW